MIFFYPRTNMSLDFSPVKISSSSRTTSSVFQMITLSSNLDTSRNTKYMMTRINRTRKNSSTDLTRELTSLVSSVKCRGRGQVQSCLWGTCPPTSRFSPETNTRRHSLQGHKPMDLLSVQVNRTLNGRPVRFPVCRGGAGAGFLRVLG